MGITRASIELLQRVPIFGSLSAEELQRVAEAPTNGVELYRSGEMIVAENDVADCMYIVLDGAVDVRITAVGGREITIATLKHGEFFGEQALLPGSTGRRNATVRALSDCRLFRIAKGDVTLGLAKMEDGPLPIVAEEVNNEDRVRMLLRSVRLFRSLTPRDLKRVNEWTETVDFDDGDIIVREAEEGDFMYIVLDGAVDVFVTDDDGRIITLGRLTAGHYFGEQALLPGGTGKRNANVRADGRTTLVRVAKRYFQLIVNHDNKLMLALKAVGDAQRRRISDLIGRGDPW